MPILHKPTNPLVEKYIAKFRQDERYALADQAITNLFQKFPENKIVEDVLLKISVINDLYSTNIYGTFRMAEHIKALNIDSELQSGTPHIVAKIATGHGIISSASKKEIIFYSFATKYCSWHNQSAFPIYDRFVGSLLEAYRDADRFANFSKEDLKNYERFKSIITEFKDHYGLTQENFKGIDKFLWIYGKEWKAPK